MAVNNYAGSLAKTGTTKLSHNKDIPPTASDKALRQKHTKDSVYYNLRHMIDHGDAMLASIDKMKTVSKPLANQVASDVRGKVDTITKMVDKKGTMMADKESKKEDRTEKGEEPGETKKTGTFQGKSNKLGGGGRFAQMKAKGVTPALAAFIGRKKYGAKSMAKMAAKGKAKK